jgi:hypothetical protein
MTVKELVVELQKLSPDLPVVVDGYAANGYDLANTVQVINVKKREDEDEAEIWGECVDSDGGENSFDAAYLTCFELD